MRFPSSASRGCAGASASGLAFMRGVKGGAHGAGLEPPHQASANLMADQGEDNGTKDGLRTWLNVFGLDKTRGGTTR
ncbi:UNVERIFIED_CONTAM: hypothetical protein Sradi_6152700 [Sesamum radiatum]|uniref:Uncharacterized protein n=1 Tax=Sesamum radiatum TaxID=300843 RepID=A0AAW2KKM4_SESRA